jgi:ubiquinone/menaquinone biosynthesis C-methylase UbiE
MQTTNSDASAFVGNVPENYDKYMVPMLMRPYAEDIATRVASHQPAKILEAAAGTGVVTEALRAVLPEAEITATDLNQDMLDRANQTRPNLNVKWQTADATAFPFPDNTFDVVVMQFGYMFLPDKVLGCKEAFRVLKPGGHYFFNVWDSLQENAMTNAIGAALTDTIEPGPPSFLNIPFGFYDPTPILAALEEAGFAESKPTWVEKESISETAREAATGMIFGSPMYGLIVENGKDPGELRDAAASALASQFGDRPMRAKMKAIVFEAVKPKA